jgi:hypothetical protein
MAEPVKGAGIARELMVQQRRYGEAVDPHGDFPTSGQYDIWKRR